MPFLEVENENSFKVLIRVLMVAEKPIMASQIAKQLAKGVRISFRRGITSLLKCLMLQ